MVNQLVQGFKGFRESYFFKREGFFQNLTRRGQTPKIMIICCSDSRVDPAILFGARPGELFVVRNVANLIPPYKPDGKLHGVSAAVEFGVRDLNITSIVVLGHAFCGGISTLCKKIIDEKEKSADNENKIQEREFIDSWMDIAKPALKNVNFDDWPGDSQHKAEKLAVLNSIKNLKTFPWIKTAIKEKVLHLHGWWFDMENGALWANEGTKEEFTKLVP